MVNSELRIGNGKVYPRRKRVGFPFAIHYSPFLILFFFLLSPGISQWTARTGEMGPVYSIVESPWGDLYAGTSSGVRRLDEGVGWVRADSGLPVDSVEGIFAYDLVVKGEYLFAATDSGVYRHNGGNGWVATMDTNLTIGGLIVKDSALFARVWWNHSKPASYQNKGGMYRSYDNGNSWTQVSNTEFRDSLWTWDFAVVGSILFMTAGGDVHRSDDDGESWRVPHDDSVFEYGRNSLCVMGSRLYAGGGGGRIYRSDDSGSTWTRIDGSLPSSTFLVTEQTLFVGGGSGGVFFSLDSGDTWQDWSQGIWDEDRNRNIHSLLVHDDYLLAGISVRNCSPNECFDPLGRIWQRPLSEVVSVDHKPFAHRPAARLRVIRGAGGGIEFTLQQGGWVKLGLYTPGGKLAATLAQGKFEGGVHRVALGTSELPSGVYIARLEAPGVSHAQKILIEN